MATLYPPSPVVSDRSLLEPSLQFKKQVIQVALSILLFFLFYFVLLALAFGLLAGCIMAGIFMITLKIHWATLAIGAGLVVLGIMVFIFFFKFIFSVSRDVNESRVEVKEAEQPELFAFIRQLSKDVKAPFPKRIFFSPDVNASVFYNSSFLSLFLPVKKNLEIGLGLVNSLNVSEFKAVLAHEFGHFSQSSMKLGSYVYTVNRVLYNLVYEYDGWDRLLQRWANVGGLFGVFASITSVIVNGLRYMLREAYHLITLRYMALSREMEYNADLVAASVAGEENMISALRKIDFTSSTFDLTIEKLRHLGDKKLQCEDLFARHVFLNRYYATKLNIPVEQDMVLFKDQAGPLNVQSRIKITNQWASHPGFEERKMNLEKCKVLTESATASAWVLFNNPEKVRKEMTGHFYKLNLEQVERQQLTNEEFEKDVLEDDLESLINSAFSGFYNGRLLPEISDELIREKSGTFKQLPFSELYNKANREKMDRYFQNKSDLETLVAIRDEARHIKSFDFDGMKYNRTDLPQIIASLEKELVGEENWFNELNLKAFLYNYELALNQTNGDDYLSSYKKVQDLQALLKHSSNLLERLQLLVQRLQGQMQFTEEEVFSINHEISNHKQEIAGFIKTFPFRLEDFALNEEQLDSIRKLTAENENEDGQLAFHIETFNHCFEVARLAYRAIHREWRMSIVALTDFQYKLN